MGFNTDILYITEGETSQVFVESRAEGVLEDHLPFTVLYEMGSAMRKFTHVSFA